MKKIIASSLIIICILFLSGCNEEKKEKQNNNTVKVENEKDDKFFDLAKWNLYQNENFTIRYPEKWTSYTDKYMVGPIFLPPDLNIDDIRSKNYQEKIECFYTVVAFTNRDSSLPCKTKLEDINIRSNLFTKCQFTAIEDNTENISYQIRNTENKTNLLFNYNNNPDCEKIIEKSLETLEFK